MSNLIRQHILQHAAGRTKFNTRCPRCELRNHRKDKKLALWVDLDKNLYKCFRCDSYGQVYPNNKRDWSPQDAPDSFVTEIPLPAEYQPLHGVSKRFRAYTNYAHKRQIPEDLWAPLFVGFCDTGPYRGRLILPVINSGRLEGWVARSVLPSDRSYLYPPGMRRGQVLFNADRLQKCAHSPILVVEGWLDAIYLWPHAVAVLGSPSHKHLELLANAKDDVVFVLDGDAWVKGLASAMMLRLHGKKAASVRLPPTLDPDDLPAQVVHDLAMKSLQEL